MPHLADAYGLARWITGDRADAEDVVVQEACLRALRAIGSFAGGNARAWTLTIVRNTAYTWLVKNRPALLVESIGSVRRAHRSTDRVRRAGSEAERRQGDAARPKRDCAAAAFRETLVLRDIRARLPEIAAVTRFPRHRDVAAGARAADRNDRTRRKR
jgi:RNA polymerase sigma-70 factor (ECF subfamily)